MSGLRAATFGALVIATIGAFFVTQHLKVSNPLINGSPRPDPPAINPIAGRDCVDLAGDRVSFRRTRLSFYLQSRSDTVGVYVIDSSGDQIATITTGRSMRLGERSVFTWNGREGDHSDGPYAPPGAYYFRVALQQAARTFTLPTPVEVITSAPQPLVIGVQAQPAAGNGAGSAAAGEGAAGDAAAGSAAAGSAPAGSATSLSGPAIIAPPEQALTIHYQRALYRTAYINVYRTDLPGRPQIVKTFRVNPRRGEATWDGMINGRPAPAGTYLVGMAVTDAACNVGTFPSVNPPAPGSTPHTGVSVRYLAAQPPLIPVPAGTATDVLIDAAGASYRWALRRVASPKVIARGPTGRHALPLTAPALRVRIPAQGAGLYELTIRTARRRTTVPLVGDGTGRRGAVRVLIVLPALTWQGENPVDDTGDGLPDTLADGQQISVQRPLVDGLPADFGEEAALLAFLDAHRMAYQLTTDLALAEGIGPRLLGHTGVILDGSLVWSPPALQAALRAYVEAGGSVLSIGVSSLLSSAPLAAGASAILAGPATAPATRDIFGAQPGPVSTGNTDLVTTLQDPLNLFGATSGALGSFSTYQTIEPPSGVSASLAGVGTGAPSIVGFRLGKGTVVEIGLPSFSSSLEDDVDSQELIGTLWRLLSRR